ncbi:MAG: hypothetical protein C4555_03290 [Dehalococcoidia bacterium]|nr:MAG: hypothetical protein C4555_03290 [Dehalococcoidia bacterium]
MNKLAKNPETLSLESPHFRYTIKGLIVTGQPTFKACEEELYKLKKINTACQLWIGMLLNFMQDKWGEEYSQVLDVLDYTAGSLANMQSVARQFPPERWREGIPYSYYQAITSLDKEQQEKLLDEVESGKIMALKHLRNKANIIRKHSGASKAECEHENMLICKKCGFITFD